MSSIEITNHVRISLSFNDVITDVIAPGSTIRVDTQRIIETNMLKDSLIRNSARTLVYTI